MNYKLNNRWHYWWIFGLTLLALAKSYEYFYKDLHHTEGHRYRNEINTAIKKIDNDIQQLSTRLLNELLKKDKTQSEIYQALSSYFIQRKVNNHFILCNGDGLIYWNNSSLYNINWCPCEQSSGQGLFLQEGNYYYGVKNKFTTSGIDYCYIFYTPIIKEIINGEPIVFHETPKSKNDLSIIDINNKPISFLENFNTKLAGQKANFLILFYIVILLILYYPFHQYAKTFLNTKNYRWALLTLFSCVVLIISISQWIVSDNLFYNSFLTIKKIHSTWVHYTLFEFLILSIIIFHLAYFFHKYFDINQEYTTKYNYEKYIIPFFNYLIIFLSIVVYCSTYKAVFAKSDFSYDFNNIINSPPENYILLLCLLFILISIFLISNKLIQSTLSFHLVLKERFLIFIISFISFALIFIKIDINIQLISFFLAASIVIWLQDYFSDDYQLNILWLISWIILISFLSSGLIFHYQNIKKRDIELQLISEFNQNSLRKVNDSASISPIATLIQNANTEHVQLYYYEDQILKYATDINRPNIEELSKDYGKLPYLRFVDKIKDGLFVKVKPNKIVVLTHSKDKLINAISLFSYIFTILILFSYIINIIHQRYNILPPGLQFSLSQKPSLRTKIQFYIILGIVLSFVIIAAVTVFFTKRTDQQLQYESLYNKTKHIHSYLEPAMNNVLNTDDAKLIIQEELKKASNLLDYNVELFDQKGFKVSNKSNFDPNYNIVSLCNPNFYFNYPQDIEDVIIINESNIENNANHFAAFKNIFHNNKRSFTLKISPEVSATNTTNNRLAILINTLLNIYVFLFLIAASLATFLANSITSPLEILRNKLKQIRLGKTNETLEYPGQDEIGELIQDYNIMVEQLDESASLLAKTERDRAWREMAKQVAHEIKNPLTPMKLSIQYLQQMIHNRADNIPEMANKVSKTLLEQIDGLTKIATEFSNFAQMPKAENEKLLLNDIVSSVHDLFRKRDDIDINLMIPIEEHYIYFDKNQIIRVLNNLINNAIQAIPENKRGRIDISLETKNKFTLIKVKDNGIGIPDHMKEKVFLPNFTTKNSGTGLGLAMCQQIIESANGKLYFTSVENVGTIFFVELPLIKITV